MQKITTILGGIAMFVLVSGIVSLGLEHPAYAHVIAKPPIVHLYTCQAYGFFYPLGSIIPMGGSLNPPVLGDWYKCTISGWVGIGPVFN